jgi:F-type H+-transporting ATPase subunit c
MIEGVGLAIMGTSFGVGLTVIGAGYGISKIAHGSVESMARQPEVAGKINMAMLLTAAFIEGVALFGCVICFMIQKGLFAAITAAAAAPH